MTVIEMQFIFIPAKGTADGEFILREGCRKGIMQKEQLMESLS